MFRLVCVHYLTTKQVTHTCMKSQFTLDHEDMREQNLMSTSYSLVNKTQMSSFRAQLHFGTLQISPIEHFDIIILVMDQLEA